MKTYPLSIRFAEDQLILLAKEADARGGIPISTLVKMLVAEGLKKCKSKK